MRNRTPWRWTVARGLGAAVLGLWATACGDLRPVKYGEPACPTFEDVRPLFSKHCASCHGGKTPEGQFLVGTAAQVVSFGPRGGARLLPGDEGGSKVLQAAKGELSGHTAIPEADQARLTDWAVRCRAQEKPSLFHSLGWMSRTDPQEFHGAVLRKKGYATGECHKCHGEDLRGGTSGVDCNSCHKNGPTGCGTCHGDELSGAPPRAVNGAWGTQAVEVGAHRTHVFDGPTHKAFACAVCHPDHQGADVEGHYRKAGQLDLAVADVTLPSFGGSPGTWNRDTATCGNIGCHEPNKNDTAAQRKPLVWTSVGQGVGACGACHGRPPSSHGDDRCELCHGQGYAGGKVDLALHFNAKVDVRGGGDDCHDCHSGPGAPLFTDLAGNTDPSVGSVGLHQKHLTLKTFRGPLGCADCHLEPATLNAPGHTDSKGPVEVFVAGTLSRADWAAGNYDFATHTCGSVYCHGGGVRSSTDQAVDGGRPMSWTQPGAVTCGSCHGNPPQDQSVWHATATLTTCVNCHSKTVDGTGAIKMTVEPGTGRIITTHLDGQLTMN